MSNFIVDMLKRPVPSPIDGLVTYFETSKTGKVSKFLWGNFIDEVLLSGDYFDFEFADIDDELRMWNGDYWTPAMSFVELILSVFHPNCKASDFKELWRALEVRVKLMRQTYDSNPMMITFRNCTLDLERLIDGEDPHECMIEHDKEHHCTFMLDHDYDPDADSVDVVDAWLDSTANNSDDVKQCMIELLGYPMYADNEAMSQIPVLVGGGSNGKSVFLSVIEDIYRGYVSNIATPDIKGFMTCNLQGMLVNIDSESESDVLKSWSIAKAVSGGDRRTVDVKCKSPINVTFRNKLYVSANKAFKLPSSDVSGKAARRRITFVPFNREFNNTDADFNPNIRKDLKKPAAMAYLVKLAVDGLVSIIKNGYKLTEYQASAAMFDEYQLENDSIAYFIHETGIKDYHFVCPWVWGSPLLEIPSYSEDLLKKWRTTPIVDLQKKFSTVSPYDLYVDVCKRSGFQAVKKQTFTKRIVTEFFTNIRSSNRKWVTKTRTRERMCDFIEGYVPKYESGEIALVADKVEECFGGLAVCGWFKEGVSNE